MITFPPWMFISGIQSWIAANGWALGGAAASIGLSLYQAKEQEDLLQDLRRPDGALTQSGGPIEFLFGRFVHSGIRVFPDYGYRVIRPPDGALGLLDDYDAVRLNAYLYTERVLSIGELDGITDIRVNGEGTLGVNDRLRGTTYSLLINDGSASPVGIAFTSAGQGNGTLERDANSTYAGLSYVSSVFWYDRDNIVYNGQPRPQYFGRGIKVPTITDVGLGDASYSENVVRVLAYYSTHPNGGGESEEDLNLPSFRKAHDIAERVMQGPAGVLWDKVYPEELNTLQGTSYGRWREDFRYHNLLTQGETGLIDTDANPVGATQSLKRYQWSVSAGRGIPSDDTVENNVLRIMQAMPGAYYFTNFRGKKTLVIPDSEASIASQVVDTIDYSDLIESVDIIEPSARIKKNRGTATFRNLNKNGEEDSVTWPEPGSAVDKQFQKEDHEVGILEETYDLSFCSNRYAAISIVANRILQSRRTHYEFRVKPLKAFRYELGDVLYLNDPVQDIENLPIIIERIGASENFSAVQIQAIEFHPIDYGWFVNSKEVITREVSQFAGVPTPGKPTISYDRTKSKDMTVTIVPPLDPATARGAPPHRIDNGKIVRYRVHFQRQVDAENLVLGNWLPLEEVEADVLVFTHDPVGLIGTYKIRVTAVDQFGNLSEPSEASDNVVLGEGPDQPSDLRVGMDEITREGAVRFTHESDLLTEGFEISISFDDAGSLETREYEPVAFLTRDLVPVFDATPVTLLDAFASVGSNVIRLRFSQTLSPSNVPSVAEFRMEVTPMDRFEERINVTSVLISGPVVVLTLARAIEAIDTALKISYTVPVVPAQRLQSAIGNEVAAVTDHALELIDLLPPVLGRIVLGTNTLRLIYLEVLDGAHVPLPADYTLNRTLASGATEEMTISKVEIAGAVVTLTLATAFNTDDRAINLSYTPGVAANQIQDAAGNVASALAESPIPNILPGAKGVLPGGNSEMVSIASFGGDLWAYDRTDRALFRMNPSNIQDTTAPYGQKDIITLTRDNIRGLTEHAGRLYGADNQGYLWLFNPDDPASSAGIYGQVGRIVSGFASAMVSHNGELIVAVGARPPINLYRINPTNPADSSGRFGLIGRLFPRESSGRLFNISGLASHQGSLYGVDFVRDSLYRINPADLSDTSGSFGYVGAITPNTIQAGGMTSHEGVLYLADGRRNTGQLYIIDPDNL